MQIQEHFEVIIKYLYNVKVAVVASPKARKLLTDKNLTPALFMRPFYADISKAYFNVIDIEDYKRPNEKDYHDKATGVLQGPLMNQRNLDKETFNINTNVQDHINRQNFLWFLQSAKLYLDNTSFDFQTTTIDQPMGVVQILSADDDFGKDYQGVNEKTNGLMKQAYVLNPSQSMKMQALILILINKQESKSIQDALKYTEILRKDFRANMNLIKRMDVNQPEAVQMHSIWLPCVKHSYEYPQQMKPGQKVQFLSPQTFEGITKVTSEHQSIILHNMNTRVDFLQKQFKEFSKTSTKFLGLFTSTTNNKDKYSNDEQQCRELGDLSFLLSDYKKAYECYKQLAGKFADRNRRFYYSLLEMTNHCLVFSKKYGQWFKSDSYQYFQRDARIILENPQHFIKEAIFVVYSVYVFGVFKKEFIKQFLYQKLKLRLKDQDVSSIIGILIQEQVATFHLMYNPVERRNYANSLLKVGMLFSEAKLQLNAFHCFKTIENIYKDTFSVIQIFVYTYLSKMCLENGQFASAVIYLRKGWNAISNRITEDRFNQFIRNYEKILAGIIDSKAENYLEQPLGQLRFPVITQVEMAIEDQICQQKTSKMSMYNFNTESNSSQWTLMGEEHFGSDNISRNVNLESFRKLESFDALSIEKKQLVYRFRSAVENDKIIEKNVRVCFIGEEVKIQFYISNPLFKEIQLSNCKVIMTVKKENSKPSFDLATEVQNVKIKGNSQKMIEFIMVPKETGIYQLSKMTWSFNSLYNQYEIPEYRRNTERSYYFRLNVQDPPGKLRIVLRTGQETSFVGMVQEVTLELHNQGEKPIEDIVMVANDTQLFGFRIRPIKGSIAPGEKLLQTFKIRIYTTDVTTTKCLFIYKTEGRTRLKRLISPLSPIVVANISNISCQKLSSHIHLLSFQVENYQMETKLNTSLNLMDGHGGTAFQLKEMILGQGFQILKVESTKMNQKTSYTFFLQKNPNAPSQRHLFQGWTGHDLAAFEPFCEADQVQRRSQWQKYDNKSYPYDHHERMTILFVFNYEGRIGIFHPKRVSTNPKLLKILDKQSKLQDFLLPFDFKAKYDSEISHNFQEQPYLEIPVQFRIKNIFTECVLNISVQFLEGDAKVSPSDILLGGSWQGQTLYNLSLERDKEAVIELNFVVFGNGLYDMSKIRYKLKKEGTKTPVTIMHNQFQKLYLEVGGVALESAGRGLGARLPQEVDLLD